MPSDRGTGLYIHVPFCVSRCVYCDFYSTTGGLPLRQAYQGALLQELTARAGEAASGGLRTVYVGGGTPSCLGAQALSEILHHVRRVYTVAAGAEITVEANPDDVTPAFCTALKAMRVNRVSLGIQTFDDTLLRFLRRRHTGAEAVRAVNLLTAAGIDNVSMDLIYGLPGQTFEAWQADVRAALSLPVRHLSAYALMYEPGTPLTRMRDGGDVAEADDDLMCRMFDFLIDATAAAGMEHYEISNFARPRYASRHNTSYWTGVPYIGAGPGAHSYDGRTVRRSNDADLSAYVASAGRPPHRVEHLSPTELCNERVMTSLRLAAGLDLAALERDFGAHRAAAIRVAARPYVADGLLEEHAGRLRLTRAGIMVSDMVMSDLMSD